MGRALVLALICWTIWLAYPARAEDTVVSGFFETYSAVATSDGSLARLRPLGYLDLRQRFNDTISLRVSGRAWHDFAFSYNHTYSTLARNDEQDWIELREAYLDISAGRFQARIGN